MLSACSLLCSLPYIHKFWIGELLPESQSISEFVRRDDLEELSICRAIYIYIYIYMRVLKLI